MSVDLIGINNSIQNIRWRYGSQETILSVLQGSHIFLFITIYKEKKVPTLDQFLDLFWSPITPLPPYVKNWYKSQFNSLTAVYSHLMANTIL